MSFFRLKWGSRTKFALIAIAITIIQSSSNLYHFPPRSGLIIIANLPDVAITPSFGNGSHANVFILVQCV